MKTILIFLSIFLAFGFYSFGQEKSRTIRMPVGAGTGIFLNQDQGSNFAWDLHTGFDIFLFKNINPIKGVHTGAEYRFESLPNDKQRGYIYGKLAYLHNQNPEAKFWFYGGLRHVLSFGKESFRDKIYYRMINTRYLVAEPYLGIQKKRLSLDFNLLTDYRLKTIKSNSGDTMRRELLFDSFGLFLRVQYFLFR